MLDIIRRIRITPVNGVVVLEFSKFDRFLTNTMELNPALWVTKWIMDYGLVLV